MSEEFKTFCLVVFIGFCVATSAILFVNTIGKNMEITNERYQILSDLKERIDAEPNNNGFDPYREFLSKATQDKKITNEEYEEYRDLRNNIKKENLIRKLSK